MISLPQNKESQWAVLGGISFLFCVFLMNTASHLRLLDTRLEHSRTKIAYQKGLVKQQAAINSLYQQVNTGLQYGKEADEKVNELSDEIEDTAQKLGLVLEEIRPLPVIEKDGASYARVAVLLEGEYSKMGSFILRLLSLPLPVKIERFQLLQKSHASLYIKAEMDLSIVHEIKP